MNEEAAADVARRLISAADIFREQNPYLDQARSGWSAWRNSVPEASELFSKAVQDVVDANLISYQPQTPLMR